MNTETLVHFIEMIEDHKKDNTALLTGKRPSVFNSSDSGWIFKDDMVHYGASRALIVLQHHLQDLIKERIKSKETMIYSLYPSFPRPNIPLGYSALNSKKAYKQLWDKDDAEFILECMCGKHVNNISTWFEPESGKHVITVIADHDSIIWNQMNSVLDYLKAEKEG